MPGILFSEDGENLWAITIGAGYGANARSQLRFGGTIKRLSAEIPNGFDSNFNPTTEHIDGFAFDFGAAMVFKSGSDDAWNLISQFGMAATDQGSDPKTLSGYSDKLPSRVGLGASFLVASALDDIAGARVPVFSGILNLDAHLPNDGDAVYSIGMEAALVQILFMRTGVEFLSGRRFGDDSITSWGVGLGLPVQSFRFRLDYGKQEEEFIDGGVVSLLVLKEL
jgi:hypothetical protein